MASEHKVKNLGDFEIKQIENLKKAQSLTDYCYTALRLEDGLAVEKLVHKFGPSTLGLIQKSADSALKQGHMVLENGHFKLTSSGFIISNQIFEKFAFFEEDLS
jgi:coproporphyrinogen III oxidase-like Fe-S oxidoreductase